MKKMIATLLFLLLGTPAARALELSTLTAHITQARKVQPQTFARLERLKAHVLAEPLRPEHRGSIARAMKALGPDGVWALVELVRDRASLERAEPLQRRTLLVGALEALRELGDRRLAVLYQQLLDGGDADEAVVRAAAEALGALADDDAAAFLIARARPGHAQERAAIFGLAFCRRIDAAQHLASRLTARPDAATAEALADAAGFLGSSWAWTALGEKRAAEGDAVRGTLSRALVGTFAEEKGPARDAVGRALLMIDHPSLPNELQFLHDAGDAALVADVAALERRLHRVHE